MKGSHGSVVKLDWPEAMQKSGRWRWGIWTVAVLAHTVGTFHWAAMGPMADRVMADFGISAAVFGSLGAAYFYVYAAMQLPSGTLADTIGPRKTITVGLLLSTLGSVIMCVAPSFAIVYTGRLVVSLGVSIVWLSVVKLIMGWFRSRELATMTGLSISVANLGQLAAATPLALSVIWVGWRMSFVAVAALSLALAVVNWFTIQGSAAQAGPSMGVGLNQRRNARAGLARDSLGLSLVGRFGVVFGNGQFWVLSLVGLGTYGAYSTLLHHWGVLYLMQTQGVARDFAGNFLLVSTIGLMLGAPLLGFLSDRVFKKRRLPLILFTALSLVSFLLLALWNGGRPPLGTLYPLCFVMGLTTGTVFITFACVGDIAQPSVRGVATGLVNTGGFVGAAVGQVVFGHILDLGWEGQMAEGARVYPAAAFQHGLLLCCILAGLGLVAAFLVKETHCRESYGTET